MRPDDLSSRGLCLAFWDRSTTIRSSFVAQRCKQLTLFYKNSAFPHAPLLVHHDIDSLLGLAATSGAKWVLVQSFGHLTLRRRFFEHLLDYLQDKDFFLLGHILDYGDHYFELHHQCFLVNLEKYRRYGRPRYGAADSSRAVLRATQRSIENFHDEYTPHWIEPASSGGTRAYTLSHEGHGLIAAAIENGERVHNFTHEMRNLKTYLYPTATTENFEAALRDPYAVAGLELNVCQKAFLSGMAYNWDAGRRSIFMYNTEAIGYEHRKVPMGTELAALFSVASGFKPLKILADNGFSSKTKVFYFDYCRNALDFRKLLLERWDGTRFVDFLRSQEERYRYGHYQCIPRNDLSTIVGDPSFADLPLERPDYSKLEALWQKTLDEFGGEQSFRNLWERSRTLETDYVHCDLITAPEKLSPYLQRFRGTDLAFFWSNSFSVETAYTFLDATVIEDGFENWAFILRQLPVTVHLFGTTPVGVDLQHVPRDQYEVYL